METPDHENNSNTRVSLVTSASSRPIDFLSNAKTLPDFPVPISSTPQSNLKDPEKSSIVNIPSFDNSFADFIKVYCDFGYFMGFIPFRLKKSYINKGFYLSKSRLQQAICIVAHCFILFRYGSRLRKLNFDDIGKKSIVYFDIFGIIATFLYQLVFVRTLWTKSQHFLTSVDYIANSQHLPKPKSKPNFKSITIAICTIYTLVCISNPILGHELLHSSEWSLNLMARCYIEDAEHMFFLKDLDTVEKCDPNLTSAPFSPSALEIFLGILLFIIHLYRNLAGYFVDLSILMCTLTLWIPARAFEPYVKENTSDLVGPFEKYNSLKELSAKLSSTIGSLVVIYFLEGILYYSSHLDDLIVLNDWFSKFRVSVFVATFFMILTFNGKTCKVVEEAMHYWINYGDNGSRIPQHKLSILINELNYHAVGLSGNGLFTISFEFFTNMTGLVVTYFIITLDFKSK